MEILFGRWITIPQGQGFLEFSSANFLVPLFSANRGFFNWTPVMFIGFVGLFIGLRRSPLLYASSLLVFLITAWVNGSVPDYDLAAGDAFGAKRFTLVVPLMALGLGAFLEAASTVLQRAPLLAPTGFLLLLFLWNVGLISHFRDRQYREMAPLEDLVADQARGLRLVSQELLGWVAGERGRAFAYEVFSAEYFYTRFNRSGTIDLRTAGPDYLLRGWSSGSRRRAPRPFRRALYPEACVRIPLKEPFDLRTVVTARAPKGLESQTVTATLNGEVLTSAHLPNKWQDIPFTLPERYFGSGRERALPSLQRGSTCGRCRRRSEGGRLRGADPTSLAGRRIDRDRPLAETSSRQPPQQSKGPDHRKEDEIQEQGQRQRKGPPPTDLERGSSSVVSNDDNRYNETVKRCKETEDRADEGHGKHPVNRAAAPRGR